MHLLATLTPYVFFEPEQATTPATLIAIAITILGEVLAVFVVWRLLVRGRAATGATLSWIFVMLAAPYIGVLLYYLLGRRLHRRRLKLRAERVADWSPPDQAVTTTAHSAASTKKAALETSAVLDLVAGIDEDSVHSHCQVDLIPDGPQFVEAARDALRSAQHFVHLQTYILRPDQTGLALLSALTDAAKRGVEVRLLYDSIGSFALKSKHLAPLLRAGGQAVAFMPLFWRRRPFTLNLRNHRKQLLVDGRVGFCGGRNIGDEYARDRFGEHARWLDVMVRVRGTAVLARLQRVFAEDWISAVDEHDDGSSPEEKRLSQECYYTGRDDPLSPPAAKNCTLGVVDGGPHSAPSRHHLVMFQLLASARQSIKISSPYLIPHTTILTALLAASARGVRVQILTNGRRAESRVLFHAKRSFYPALVEGGIEVFETTEDYNHGKLVLIDQQTVYVGSPNLDVRSEELNFELALVVETTGSFMTETHSLFDERCGSANLVTESDLATSRLTIALQNSCRLLSPLL